MALATPNPVPPKDNPVTIPVHPTTIQKLEQAANAFLHHVLDEAGQDAVVIRQEAVHWFQSHHTALGIALGFPVGVVVGIFLRTLL